MRYLRKGNEIELTPTSPTAFGRRFLQIESLEYLEGSNMYEMKIAVYNQNTIPYGLCNTIHSAFRDSEVESLQFQKSDITTEDVLEKIKHINIDNPNFLGGL